MNRSEGDAALAEVSPEIRALIDSAMEDFPFASEGKWNAYVPNCHLETLMR